jgi:hypothetical protein
MFANDMNVNLISGRLVLKRIQQLSILGFAGGRHTRLVLVVSCSCTLVLINFAIGACEVHRFVSDMIV